MDEAEFDRFADEYRTLHAENIRLSGETPDFFAEYKAKDAASITGGQLPASTILDFGTGIGNSLPFLHRHFPSHPIVGLDVSRRSLEIGRARFGNLAQFVHFNGHRIPSEDNTYGMAFSACVFHHIDPQEHTALLSELHRVLHPGGWLIIHEHNPSNPLTVRAVRDCPFDENAQLIDAPTFRNRAIAAGFTDVKIHYRIFFPGFLSFLRPLEKALTWLPLGAQYCLSCRK
jgi:ubiquinone/menaquinone biosynthesis C-methylase UbiE